MIKSISSISLLICLAFTCGCAEKNEIDMSPYITTYEHIKTEQFSNSPGRRGIYWLDNETLILDASVKSVKDKHELGLYVVNTNGAATRIVDIDYPGSYYCVTDKKVYVRSRDGLSKVLLHSENLEIIIGKVKRDFKGRYSSFHCDFVDPVHEKGVLKTVLRPEDGVVESTIEDPAVWDTVYQCKNGDCEKVRLGKEVWDTNWRIRNGKKPIWSTSIVNLENGVRFQLKDKQPVLSLVKAYLPFSDSYLGYPPLRDGSCDLIWLLHRKDWSVGLHEICPEKEFYNGTRTYVATKVGLILEHTRGSKGGLYLVSKNEMQMLDAGVIDATSVSPDGCKIAYAKGDWKKVRKSDGDFRQQLNTINVCKYVKDKEKGRADHII